MSPRTTTLHRLISVHALLCCLLPLPSFNAWANEEHRPSRSEFEAALPEGGNMTGREIYNRFLENRYRKSSQSLRVVSTDQGGSAQTTTFTVRLQDLRNENDEPRDGLVAQMLVEISDPFDMRHTAYLMVRKKPGPDDEFIYQPSQRRVRRVDLKRTPLMGTDYTFDDIAYHDLDDADYRRLPDESIEGVDVYVVEADIRDSLNVEYHRTISYLEKEHFVPLKVRYWDGYGVEVKRLQAPHGKIRAFGDMWIAGESTMRDLLQGTESTLLVDAMDLAPKFPSNLFSVSRLTRGR